jgi:hypothetical protein
VLEIDECLCRPESLPQFLAGHEVARSFQQRLENLKGLIGEFDANATLPQFARAQIQLERAKANESIDRSGHCGSGPSLRRPAAWYHRLSRAVSA